MSEMDKMCERYGIQAEWVEGPAHERDDEGWEHHGGMVRVWHHFASLRTVSLTIPYLMGMGLDPTEMGPADVVSSIALDARLGEETFEDFCSELGYDTDSRKAYASWEACRDTAKRFTDFCTTEAMRDDLTTAEH